jgi:hypothetical protein
MFVSARMSGWLEPQQCEVTNETAMWIFYAIAMATFGIILWRLLEDTEN